MDESLRGIGQVVFCNSPVSGALLLAALLKGDIWLGTLAALGTASATATAKLANLDEAATKSGLMGYNGCLVGCAFSVFVDTDPTTQAVLTTIVAAGTAPLTLPLRTACGAVPQWTLAFNAATLSVLSFIKPLVGAAPADPSVAVGVLGYLLAPLTGVSQIFVVNDPLAGALMLCAIGYYSPQCAAFTVLGSTVGMGTGLVLGAAPTEIAMGLWGFNSALTSLAVSVFFVPGAPMYALAGGGAVVTAGVFGGAKGIMAAALGTPALTLPFCAIASACYMAPRLGVPQLVLAAAPHSPEKNKP